MGIMGFIFAVIIIGIIIFIHEFGHYIVGKLSGASVSQFSIGWGPKLFSFKKRETEYRISWIPFIGGYVRLPGMEGESAELTEQEKEDIKKYNLKTFEGLKTWQKFLAFIGGVGLQIILCILILTIVISILGKPVDRVVIATVLADSPAKQAGLKKLDSIIKANGKRINSAKELIQITASKANKKLDLVIKRKGELKNISLIPEYSGKLKRAVIGVSIAQIIDYEKEKMSWSDYLFGGVVFTGKLSIMIIQTIWGLISHKISLSGVMGPVGIVVVTKEVVKTGFIHSLLFFAMININLAIINLIPFPALDGGHVLILSIERLFRFKIKPRIKETVNMVGFALVILLMVYVTFNDIARLFSPKAKQANIPQKVEMEK